MLAQYRKAVKAMAQPAWQAETRRLARSKQEVKVLSTTSRAVVSNQQVTLTSGSSAKKLSGGGRPRDLARGVEFGTVAKHRRFKSYQRAGYVVYPAAAKVIPRIASLMTQTVVRTLHEAWEGKRG